MLTVSHFGKVKILFMAEFFFTSDSINIHCPLCIAYHLYVSCLHERFHDVLFLLTSDIGDLGQGHRNVPLGPVEEVSPLLIMPGSCNERKNDKTENEKGVTEGQGQNLEKEKSGVQGQRKGHINIGQGLEIEQVKEDLGHGIKCPVSVDLGHDLKTKRRRRNVQGV